MVDVVSIEKATGMPKAKKTRKTIMNWDDIHGPARLFRILDQKLYESPSFLLDARFDKPVARRND